MKITEALLGEHGALYAQLRMLEQAAAHVGSLDAIALAAEVLSAGLVSHAQLEDELLFDPLARAGADGPWAEMMEEHEQIAASLRAAQTAPTLEAARGFLHDALRAADEHFKKEEELLFPLAEQQLKPGQSDDLVIRWARARGVTLA